MKISASVYSSKERSIKALVQELDECHIDLLHIDCNDDPKVFDDIREIRKFSNTPIDIHIISDQPEKYYGELESLELEYVTFQFENLSKKLTFPKTNKTRYGLAIISDTPVEVFDDYKDECDFILIMTTTPGQSGGKFRKDNFKKIRKFRNTFPGKEIHVDGGVNHEVAFILRILGVHSVVSGSYLVNHKSIGTALLHLKSSIVHSDYKLKDFMIDREDAPVLNENRMKVRDIIQSIDQHKLGFTIIENNEEKLIGLSSNADVRRGLLKHIDNFNALQAEDIVNFAPVTINEDSSTSELLNLINQNNFLISFLPVVDSDNKLKGAVTFINLIRSES
ncbi:CBS domain-containing protein [Hyphobacterium sp. CCMP332]|nr:CBS domain-containing protein [Hyphobacterium sp. CCMP332]